MQYSIVGGAIAALLAVIAVVVLSSGDPAAGSPSAATALLEAIVGVDHSKETLTLADLTLTAREQPAAAEQALAKIHAKIKSSPDDSGLHALNAFLLLESGFGARPPSDEQLAEGKKAHEKALKLLGSAAQTADLVRSEFALGLAQGEAEASLAHGQQLVELDGSVASRAMWAKAYLAATCSKACAARHQEQLAKHAPDGAVFTRGKEPGTMASAHRAAGMWRVMEAGKVLQAAAGAHPTHIWALAASRASARLRSLNTAKISSSAELFELAGCAAYEGVKLDGARCPKDGEDPYERKRKLAAAKRKKAGKKGVK